MFPLLAEEAPTGEVTLTYTYLGIAALVGLLAYYMTRALAKDKAAIDAEEEKLSAAAGGAEWIAGLPELADVLRKAGTGNIKRTFRAAEKLFDKYFKTARGPITMARDVFVKSWPHLRDDKEYGQQVREIVVATALGFDKDDLRKNIDFSRAGGKLEKVGWSKCAKAAHGLAVDDYKTSTTQMVSLCDEILEEDGEMKLALRVAKPTIDVCFNHPTYRDQMMPILREYVAKDDERIAAENARALERAKAAVAKAAPTP